MKPLLCAALFLELIASALPQQHQTPVPVITVESELVTLAVNVVDSRDRFVGGLDRDAFTVYDGTERREIRFFSREAIPATIGLVIDSSTSMRTSRDDVTAAATAFVNMSHPQDEFFTVSFNEAVWPGLPPGVLFTSDADQLRAALTAAPARGMSAVYDAIDLALEHLERGSRDRRALIVVSDGGDNASSRTLDSVLDHVRRTSAVIYTVSVVTPDDHGGKPSVLRKLAADSGGGRAFSPRTPAEVRAAFEAIAQEIRSGYTIGFEPADDVTGFRPVRVSVTDPAGRPLVARTRAGYYAGPKNN